MFRRNNQRDVLPTSFGGGGGGGLPLSGGGSMDGSGRSIKMDAPVVKAWKKASGYTRWTYYILGFTCLMIFCGYRSMRYWNASMWLTCHQQECVLEITPPGSRTKTVVFHRSQLHSAQPVKVDRHGNFLEIDNDKYEPPKRNKKKKNPSSVNNRGPDEHGRYKTYQINILANVPRTEETEKIPDGDFSEVSGYLRYDDQSGMNALHFGQFGLSQSRIRVRSNVNKVDSYTKRRRQKLLIKESATLPWQGILCLVFGLVGLLLTILIGQFWDEEPRRQGGPGARRSRYSTSNRGSSSRTRATSASSSGYHYQKKY